MSFPKTFMLLLLLRVGAPRSAARVRSIAAGTGREASGKGGRGVPFSPDPLAEGGRGIYPRRARHTARMRE
jgi:hypothetical protein